MPEKKNPHSKPAMKAVGLYALLLFSGKEYSLSRLASIFDCSKQSIIRMIEDIEMAHKVAIEKKILNKQRFYQVKSPPVKPHISLSPEEIQSLLLCRDMVQHILPKQLKDEIGNTISRATVLLSDYETRTEATLPLISSYGKGIIDYSDFQSIIETVIIAVREHRFCEMDYTSVSSKEVKTYTVAPLDMLNYRNALYIRCRFKENKPNKADYRFAIHRIKKIKILDATHEFDNVEKVSVSNDFGFVLGEPFRVKLKFSPQVSMYLSERKWSHDQKMEYLEDGSLILEFTATSKPELIAWILSFGPEVEVIDPENIKNEIIDSYSKSLDIYS